LEGAAPAKPGKGHVLWLLSVVKQVNNTKWDSLLKTLTQNVIAVSAERALNLESVQEPDFRSRAKALKKMKRTMKKVRARGHQLWSKQAASLSNPCPAFQQ